MKIKNFRFAILTLEWERQEEDPPEREVDLGPAMTERLPEEIYEEARSKRTVGFARNGERRGIDT